MNRTTPKIGLFEAIESVLSDKPQTTVQIHKARCKAQGLAESSSGTGATAACLQTLFKQGKVAKFYKSGQIGVGTLWWHK
jgi:mevalonate pyrophosphate decarboxylase